MRVAKNIIAWLFGVVVAIGAALCDGSEDDRRDQFDNDFH